MCSRRAAMCSEPLNHLSSSSDMSSNRTEIMTSVYYHNFQVLNTYYCDFYPSHLSPFLPSPFLSLYICVHTNMYVCTYVCRCICVHTLHECVYSSEVNPHCSSSGIVLYAFETVPSLAWSSSRRPDWANPQGTSSSFHGSGLQEQTAMPADFCLFF